MSDAIGSLFSQPWWLDAVAPGAWDEVVITKGGTTFARLPYVVRRRWGFTYLTMPPLTQTLGPFLRPYPGKYANRLSEEIELMTALIEGLPRFDLFQQHFHHSITNWLPFYWQGFEQTTRYSYVIEDLNDLDAVWAAMRKNIRGDIRKAEKHVTVREDLSLDSFLALNEKVFRRQGHPLPYTRELVSRLDAACEAHACRKMLFAQDAQGQVHAAVYIVWDEQTAYYLMGGADPELRTSGASSLLIWHAIQFAASVTNSFDLEGSMIKPIERFFRAFGARQRQYFRITKVQSLPLKAALDIKFWFNE